LGNVPWMFQWWPPPLCAAWRMLQRFTMNYPFQKATVNRLLPNNFFNGPTLEWQFKKDDKLIWTSKCRPSFQADGCWKKAPSWSSSLWKWFYFTKSKKISLKIMYFNQTTGSYFVQKFHTNSLIYGITLGPKYNSA